MDRQQWMVICGIAALALYTLSWVFRWMAWPGSDYLRLGALLPFIVGASIWIYDWRRKNKAQAPNRHRKTGWEDILDDEEKED